MAELIVEHRVLERPIVHRYQEIEAFPQALNNSQMWNFHSRMFLTDARENMTAEVAAELPQRYTEAELNALEKTLKEHEAWLYEWVEKQKSVKMNEDPVIETKEMKARAKTLETQLQRLVKKKPPRPPKSTATASSSTSAAAEETGSSEGTQTTSTPEPESSQPMPEVHDEL